MTGDARHDELFSVSDLRVEFPVGRRERLVAVKDVSFTVRKGETLGLIGESGSGKSTLARSLVGLAPISGGVVRWRGRPFDELNRAERIAYRKAVQMVFQDPHSALDPRRTIAQSVREPLDVLNIGPRSDRDAAVRAALERVELSDHLAGRYPHELSGGQKQRANIARALITSPEVLICDESVAALDVALQAEILNLLQDLKHELAMTLVFISHDLGVVAHVSDRVCVMYLGEIVEDAPADALVGSPRHPYTEALMAAEPRIFAFAEGASHRVTVGGDIPSPIAPPPGCRFHTRCPFAEADCRTQDATLAPVGRAHRSACLRVADLYTFDEKGVI